MIGVFVTAFYSFRLLYLTFHGKERFVVEAHAHGDHAGHDGHDGHHLAQGHLAHAPHESPWVVTVPLVLLAIPSMAIGYLTVGPMLFGDFFGGAIVVREANDVVGRLGHHFHGPLAFALEGFRHWPFWLALAGFASATWLYLLQPALAPRLRSAFAPIVRVLENKYGFDDLYQALFARGSLRLGRASLEGWRHRRDRQWHGQRVRRGGRSRVLRGALGPVRPPVRLRIRHDPRPDRAARLAGLRPVALRPHGIGIVAP